MYICIWQLKALLLAIHISWQANRYVYICKLQR